MKDKEFFKVSDDKVCQINRVVDTNDFIIKSRTEIGAKAEGIKIFKGEIVIAAVHN